MLRSRNFFWPTPEKALRNPSEGPSDGFRNVFSGVGGKTVTGSEHQDGTWKMEDGGIA